MEKELCVVCTGSYTGEFSPKWRGPWAQYFNASGEFLPLDKIGGGLQAEARLNRLTELRAQNRVPLSSIYYHR